jgi:hypothetical protein
VRIDYPWIQHILGPSEKTLPTLAHRMQHYHARPRLWFYPTSPSSPTYYSDSDPDEDGNHASNINNSNTNTSTNNKAVVRRPY